VWHDIQVWFGFSRGEGNGPYYLFWSGIAADVLTVVPLFGIFFVLYRKHNCHVQGCWRIIWRTHGDYELCRKHHPDTPPRADEIKV
jgi:hypothetical protein